MASLGNEIGNKIYEADLGGVKKPEPESDRYGARKQELRSTRSTREKYIRMKYIDRKFVIKTDASQDELNIVSETFC
jgi:hypothetical protein